MCFRKICIIIAALLLVGMLTGCMRAVTMSSLEQYLEPNAPISYTGFSIFPAKEDLPKDGRADYRYNCQSSFFFDDQMFLLQCDYTQEEYKQEIARLGAVGAVYRDDLFPLPAYIMLLYNDRHYEYALVDETNLHITYFAAEATRDALTDIPQWLLPKEIGIDICQYVET